METEGIGTAEVRDRGRVTIPSAIRQQLNLENGDLVRLRVERIRRGEGNE